MSDISFNNIINNATLKFGKISNVNSDFHHNEFEPLINAVEIDWNGAQVDEDKVINTTEELLTWIKEGQKLNFDENQIQLLKDTINIIALIKEYFIGQQAQITGYYWYIGVNNPSSIYGVQSDNNIAGWHKIGDSLSGFVLNTDTNNIHLSESRIIYNVIIPNNLHIYAGDGTTNVESTYFTSLTCNISGYKAFRYIPSERYPDGVRDVTGIIIK